MDFVKSNNQLFIIDMLAQEKLHLKKLASKELGWEKARPMLGPIIPALIRWVGEGRNTLTPAARGATFGATSSSAGAAGADLLGLFGEDLDAPPPVTTSSAAATTIASTSTSSPSTTGDCISVRRTRSKDTYDAGAFTTSLVLRPCPSEEAFLSPASSHLNFNNLTMLALATNNARNDRPLPGVPNPFVEKYGGTPATRMRRRRLGEEAGMGGMVKNSRDSKGSSGSFAAGGKSNDLNFFTFYLERTRNTGTPYAQGVTEGKIPSWTGD